MASRKKRKPPRGEAPFDMDLMFEKLAELAHGQAMYDLMTQLPQEGEDQPEKPNPENDAPE